jgi:DNA-binding GntR family transcriptional regulator
MLDKIVDNPMMPETVYKKLEMAILTGHLKPRERLVESEISSQLSVKRFAARKAIQELSQKGFVELIPNKGARVIDLTDREVEDNYRVRMNLELLAAELMVQRITAADLRAIRKIQKEYAAAVARSRMKDMILKNEEFHKALLRVTGNRFLCELLDKIKNAAFALRYNTYFMLGIASRTVSDHEAIIRTLERKDLRALKRILKESIIYPKMISQSKSPWLHPVIKNARGKDGSFRK